MKKRMKQMAVACTVLTAMAFQTRTAEAELVKRAWGQGSSNTYILGLNNAVGSAVNIYTLNGTEASIIHHTGNFNGINYDMLEVKPSETTFVKVDYMGHAEWLNDIYDWGLISEGYIRAGGINANYYAWHTNPNYGQPVGGLRMAGKWTDFRGEPNLPDYGSGYVTAYWDRAGLIKLVYSGENVKYVSPDGHREVIFDESGNIVDDPRDVGTYNYSPSGTFWGSVGHLGMDIIPWVIFGNNDDDPGPIANWVSSIFS